MSNSRDVSFDRYYDAPQMGFRRRENAVAPAQNPDLSSVRLMLLGGFTVAARNVAIEPEDWRRPKAASLLKLLALTPGHQLHQDQILEWLWPNLPVDAAINNSRVTLHRLRRFLESTLGVTDLIVASDRSIAIDQRSDVWIDVDTFSMAAATAIESVNPVLYEQAARLYTGDLLPGDRYEEWTLGRRDQLRETYLDLLMRLGRIYAERGDLDRAAWWFQEVVLLEPAREDVRIELIRTLARAGKRSMALRQFKLLRDALQDELGADPDAASEQLYEDILAGRIPVVDGPDTSMPTPIGGPGRSRPIHEVPRHNIPVSLTRFISRERELHEVRSLLDTSRILTLVGPGGSGKTRLAYEVASTAFDDYPGGAWVVELAPIIDGDLVVFAVSTALGVQTHAARSVVGNLIDSVRYSELLLVLDNCEHLIDATAEFVDTLLRDCPRVRVLCSSREPLGIPGEVAWPVPPMSLPDAKEFQGTGSVEDSAAVSLFVDRAASVRPQFELTAENVADVVEICRRLDGQPLAIELAAARMRAYSTRQIADRLDTALSILTAGPRTVTDRQKTLRATFDWSYQLLGGPERSMLRRISVFAGTATLEAIEAVCSDSVIGEVQFLDLLNRLVTKSLISFEQEGDQTRYRMLATIREYARELLAESDEEVPVRERLRDWYLSLGDRAERGLVQGSTGKWMPCLNSEIDNFRAVLHWSAANDDHETTLKLASTLWGFWQLAGLLGEGRAWLETSLRDEAVEHVSEATRARALHAAGFLAQRQGNYRQAIEFTEESLERSRRIGDQWGVHYAINNLCLCALSIGDVERTITLAHENLELARETGIKPAVPTSLSSLGLAAYWTGDLARSRRYLLEAVAAAREIGFEAFTSWLLGQLADVTRAIGDTAAARDYADESIKLGENIGDQYGPALGWRVLGRIAASDGEFNTAKTLFDRSLEAFHRNGYKLRAIETLEDLAELALQINEPRRALHLLSATERMRIDEGCHVPPARRSELDAVRDKAFTMLDPESYENALNDGYDWSYERVIEYSRSQS